MFVVKITFKKPLEVIEQYIEAHREFLNTGYQTNSFIASGPQNPRVGGIILSQLKNREALESILKNDPYQLNQLADYEFIEFNPVKYHKDFTCFV